MGIRRDISSDPRELGALGDAAGGEICAEDGWARSLVEKMEWQGRTSLLVNFDRTQIEVILGFVDIKNPRFCM